MGGDEQHPPCFAVLLTLVFFDAYSQNSLNYHLDGNCIVTFVGFLLTITTILIYPSLFFCSFLLFVLSLATVKNWTEVTVENHLFVTN